jgi:uracil-DNA glycosylase family 4
VNPGLFNPEGEIMFVTIEPSHRFDWDKYDSWESYNRTFSRKFLEEWTGGPILEELLEPIQGVDMGSVWMADAIKCPPEGGIDDQTRNEEFDHCRPYLQEEIEQVRPDVIVGLGKTPVYERYLPSAGNGVVSRLRRSVVVSSIRILQ